MQEREIAGEAVAVIAPNDAGKTTLLSAMMTAFAGALHCQYQMFILPDT